LNTKKGKNKKSLVLVSLIGIVFDLFLERKTITGFVNSELKYYLKIYLNLPYIYYAKILVC
jgi:hypothetical protein